MGFEIPNMHKPFTYCELGCGSGFSLLTYAAANPHGFFIGVDFNTHHIVEAKEAAKKVILQIFCLSKKVLKIFITMCPIVTL